MLAISNSKNVESYDRFNVFVLSIVSLILISPIFSLLKGFSTAVTLFLFLISLYFNFSKNSKFIWFYFLLSSYFILISILLSIFHFEIGFIFLPFFFLTSVYFVFISSDLDVLKYVQVASNIILFISLGALIGFFYAFFIGQPNFVFINPNGLINEVFLTTMTNSRWDSFIRPSGIYDEPGALSFFICGVCFLRHLLNFDKKKTMLILMLGLVTFSVAHIIYLGFYLVSISRIRFNFRALFNLLIILILLMFIYFILVYTGAWEGISIIFFGRFDSESSGLFPGDNRSMYFFNAIDYLNDHPLNLLFGESMTTDFENVSLKYGVVGSNPLMPILSFGFFVSLPYYFILTLLFINGLKGKYHFVSIGFALVLFQREFFLVVSYSLFFMLVFKILFINYINEKKNINSLWD